MKNRKSQSSLSRSNSIRRAAAMSSTVLILLLLFSFQVSATELNFIENINTTQGEELNISANMTLDNNKIDNISELELNNGLSFNDYTINNSQSNAPILSYDTSSNEWFIEGQNLNMDSQTLYGAGELRGSAGGESDPLLTFSSDQNTGIYSPGSNQIALTTSGNRGLELTENGKIQVVRGNLQLNSNSISQVSKIYDNGSNDNFFQNSCPGGQVIGGINSDGSYTCVDSESQIEDIYVNESGDTMTGTLNMTGDRIIEVGSERSNFTSSGGLDLGSRLDAGNNIIQNVPQLQNQDSVDIDIDSNDDGTGNSFEISRNGENTNLVRVNEDGKTEILQDNLSLNENYLVDVKQINLTGGTTLDGTFDIENSNITMNENYMLNATGISTDRISAPGSAGEVNLQNKLDMKGNSIVRAGLPASGTNMWIDSSMESGRVVSSGGSRSTTYAHTGSYSWKGVSQFDGPNYADSMNLQAGKDYTVSVWIKNTGSNSQTIHWYGDSNDYGDNLHGKVLCSVSGNTDWTRCSATLSPTSDTGDVGSWRLEHDNDASSGAVYFDDIQFERGTGTTKYSSNFVDLQGDLQVDGTGQQNLNGNLNFPNNNNIQSSGTDAIRLDGNQNVEVPNGRLDINSPSHTSGALNVDGNMDFAIDPHQINFRTDNNARDFYRIVENGATKWKAVYGNENLFWRNASGTKTLNLKQNNNVRIPNGNLDVNGVTSLGNKGGSSGYISFKNTEIREDNSNGIVLEDGSGNNNLKIIDGGNVEIPNGNLDVSSNIRNSADTVVYDQSAGELLATPGSTSSTNPVFTRDGDSDSGLGFSSSDELVLVTGGTAGPRVDSNQDLNLSQSNIEGAEEIAGATGTSGEPLFTFDSDPDTGAYSPGADQYGLSTGGTSALEIDSSRNVQILDGELQLNSNNITGPDRVDGINLDSPGKAIEVTSGGKYRVIADSLNDDEITDNSLTNSSMDSSGSFSFNDVEITNDLTGTGIVNTDQISDSAVTTAKIGTDEVQNSNINNDAVQSEQIQDNQVNNSDIANSDSFTMNGLTLKSDLNMTDNRIIRIGSEESNFTSSGGLDLGGRLDAGSNDIQNAPQLQNTGNMDLDIDSDSNTNDRTFDITHDGGSEAIARFNETGDVGIPNGNLDMNGNRVENVVSEDSGDAINKSFAKSYIFNGTFLQRSRQGTFRITGPGTIEVNQLSFQPDSIRFTAQAPIQDHSEEGAGANGADETNFEGTMTGYARETGEGIEEFSMMSGGSGDSINNIRRQSTDAAAISLTYGEQSGGEIGELNATVESFDGDGFTLDVNSYDLSDLSGLVVQYQAFRASNYTNNNGTDVSEDNSLVKEDVADINFERNLDVQNDGDGTVTVDTEPEGIKQTLNVDNTANITLNMDGNDVSNVNEISGDSAPLEVSNDISMTGSSPEIDLGSGMSVRRKNGNVVISD